MKVRDLIALLSQAPNLDATIVMWIEDEDGDPVAVGFEATHFGDSPKPDDSVHFNVGFTQYNAPNPIESVIGIPEHPINS